MSLLPNLSMHHTRIVLAVNMTMKRVLVTSLPRHVLANAQNSLDQQTYKSSECLLVADTASPLQ